MERNVKLFKLNVFLISIIVTANSVHLTSAEDSIVNADFEGQRMVEMGVAMNNPLLRLLGRTFNKLEDDVTKDIDNKTAFVLKEIHKDNSSLEQRLVSERKELIEVLCQLHTCTDWTTWSDCSAKMNGTFGAQSRSRTCGMNGVQLCPNGKKGNKEDESKVCEGWMCPTNYTLTSNGLCIGIHANKQIDWASAQAACKQEGGYLLNVDSEVKAVDVNKTLEQLISLNELWIDGIRTLPAGEWRYENAQRDPLYTNWGSNEPGASDDCRAYVRISRRWFWFGRSCKSIYHFICEL